MDSGDDRDHWLEGVRRWYFGGAPGPDESDESPAEPKLECDPPVCRPSPEHR